MALLLAGVLAIVGMILYLKWTEATTWEEFKRRRDELEETREREKLRK